MLGAGGGRPWPLRRLTARLGLRSGSPASKALRRLLRELEDQGLVERFDGQVQLLRSDGLVEGELQRGGFVVDAAGREWRVADEGSARRGDRVLLWPDADQAPGAAVGEIVHVLSPEADRWVGRLRVEAGRSEVEPYGRAGPPSLRVARDDRGGAADGEMVEAVAVRRGRSRQPWARVVRALGRPGSPDADFAALVWRHRLPVEFPPDALREAGQATRRAERGGERRDLTELPFVTIDPATARDHDDAVCVETAGEGVLRLWVAIADVAHFVREGGPIDREALQRGNSVYLPDRALPMLPEALSSGACSLVPDVDRLVLAVELVIGRDGAVRDRAFHRARIRSRARLAYEDAAAVMEGDPQAPVARELHAPLRRLAEVSEWLRRQRRAAGTIDLELPEALITLDENGWPVASGRAPRTVAHRAIEEAMLAANRAVAGLLEGRGVVAVHRVHEPPGCSSASICSTTRARSSRCGASRLRSTPQWAGRSSGSCTGARCVRCSRLVMRPRVSVTTHWASSTTCTSPRQSGGWPIFASTVHCTGCSPARTSRRTS
jgi:ribonuclease R